MVGTLYLCATPIGNLEDITFRVVRILKEVDLIAAEDTRNSIKLLNHYEIKTPMTSYHEFNKIEKGKYLVEQLCTGKNIALITDAGTPGISDPGEELVKLCYEANVPVTSLPGAVACITALILSGKPTRRFCFEAFLPTDKKQRKIIIEELVNETRSIIIYEAPHRLIKTLQELYKYMGNREISVCRELTKRYETVLRTNFEDAIQYYTENAIKGECVIIIQGLSYAHKQEEKQMEWKLWKLSDHMSFYEQQGFSTKEAMKLVAKDRGVAKRDIYQELLNKS